ncbi:SDR family NAD(P)-dependent oxidoreductase [Pseudomonas marincola]|uniref:SDR family NAD(P)-dependent oxidoreductase n=1 Tax=Pseudomonas marincola TaxID=437900 RepID=UPI0008DF4355|nr:SDR family NAD(P)-dependent oxidoreductase [Pseudomonas marincola]SFU02204.1 NADP-dependent 3-hydroxy acid dehydrogenase YdfG [Pseudomonas marincola]
MAYDFIGKVILITGAAGGIGAATARELYSLGALLVLTDMQQEAVDQLAQEFDAERVLPLALDVTDAEASKRVVQSAVERFGRLDVAFANAGIAWRSDPKTLRICPTDEFRRIVEVDLFGVWNTMQAALPEVIRNQGQILVTSSIYAFINGLVNAPYAASKAGVEALARALLVELGGTGATVSVVYPGWTETAIAKIAFGGNDLATRMNETVLPNYLRQPIQPQQVAKAITQGMRSRRPHIVVPGRWTPIALLRGLLNPLIDSYLQRHKALQKLLRELESGSDGGS